MSNTQCKFNWHRPEFMGVPFQILLKQMDEAFQQHKQWSTKIYDPETALKYWNHLECLVELCENITVFHKGGGLNKNFHTSLIDRYHSFDVFHRVLK